MLTALLCALFSFFCIHDVDSPAVESPASESVLADGPKVINEVEKLRPPLRLEATDSGATLFERLNAARAARLGVKVTERRNRFPHAPAADIQPITYQQLLESLPDLSACNGPPKRID